MKKKIPVQKRIALYSLIFFLIYAVISIANGVTEYQSANKISSPIGIDYSMLYNSGKLAASGNATDIFNVPKLQEMMAENIGTKVPWDVQWFYPPTFLLMFLIPLSQIPFHISLLLWMIITLGLAVFAIYLLVPKHKILSLLVLGFPGVMLTFRWGQNSFLSTSLLGFGIYFMQSSPILAGLMFGLLTFKPQLAFFPFILLLITKEWRTLFWSIIFGLATVVTSAVAFGLDVWKAFFNNFFNVVPTLLTTVWEKTTNIQPTLYTALRLFKLNDLLTKIILALAFILVASTAAWIWKNTNRITLKGSVMVLGTFTFMPYFIQYDLMVMSIAFVLMAYDFLEYGCRKHELIILVSLWVTVYVNMIVVNFTSVQICPFIVMANMLMIFLKVKREKLIVKLQPAVIDAY